MDAKNIIKKEKGKQEQFLGPWAWLKWSKGAMMGELEPWALLLREVPNHASNCELLL